MASQKEFVDYYAILNIPAHAEFAEIKTAYRKLALANHPDKHLNLDEKVKAEERMKLINRAHDILKDAVLRSEYDRTRPVAANFPEQQPRPSRKAEATAPPPTPLSDKDQISRISTDLRAKATEYFATLEGLKLKYDSTLSASPYNWTIQSSSIDAEIRQRLYCAIRSARWLGCHGYYLEARSKVSVADSDETTQLLRKAKALEPVCEKTADAIVALKNVIDRAEGLMKLKALRSEPTELKDWEKSSIKLLLSSWPKIPSPPCQAMTFTQRQGCKGCQAS